MPSVWEPSLSLSLSLSARAQLPARENDVVICLRADGACVRVRARVSGGIYAHFPPAAAAAAAFILTHLAAESLC